MKDTDRLKLRYGPYKTPRFKYGATVFCEYRGDVVIVGLSDAPILWPLARAKHIKRGKPTPVVYRGLVTAVKKESAQAIQHWFGVGASTVNGWRKALNVPRVNDGSRELLREHFAPRAKRVQKMAVAKARDPQRRAKIAAARRGKKRPASDMEPVRKAHIGRTASEETRRKMSEAHKRRGTRPPAAGVPWTEAEDEILRSHTAKEAAEKLDRTYSAVLNRRSNLGLPDGRRKE